MWKPILARTKVNKLMMSYRVTTQIDIFSDTSFGETLVFLDLVVKNLILVASFSIERSFLSYLTRWLEKLHLNGWGSVTVIYGLLAGFYFCSRSQKLQSFIFLSWETKGCLSVCLYKTNRFLLEKDPTVRAFPISAANFHPRYRCQM